MKTLVLALIAAVLLTASAASAQVVQPTYVRPSKGAPLTLATVTASSVVATFTNSAIFDWTAFAGVVVTVTQSPLPAGTFSTCKHGVRVQALGSTTTVSSDFFLLNVANNDYQASTSQSYYVRVLPGYLRFSIGTYQANASGQPSCNYRVVATPLPFDYAGQLLTTGATSTYLPSCTEGGCTVLSYFIGSDRSYTRIQNLTTDTVYCSPVNPDGTVPVDLIYWPIRLAGESSAEHGDGGVIEITNWTGTIRCYGNVGIFQH